MTLDEPPGAHEGGTVTAARGKHSLTWKDTKKRANLASLVLHTTLGFSKAGL